MSNIIIKTVQNGTQQVFLRETCPNCQLDEHIGLYYAKEHYGLAICTGCNTLLKFETHHSCTLLTDHSMRLKSVQVSTCNPIKI